MRLTRLEVHNLRVIENAVLEPGPVLNVILGANASGKTSLLEAIHLLCTGRSFRSRRAEEFIRRGVGQTVVHARVVGEDGEQAVGVEKGPGSTRIHLGQTEVRSASTLARHLPLVLVPRTASGWCSTAPTFAEGCWTGVCSTWNTAMPWSIRITAGCCSSETLS